MSVVVAIKENGKVYIGADSQVTRGGSRITQQNPNNYKVWKVEGSNNCVMGHVGNTRDANIIRLMENIVDDVDEYLGRVDFRFVVKFVVPQIIKKLKEAHFLRMKDDYLDYLDSSFFFAYKDKLFYINSDATVLEVDDFCAGGSGASEAVGSLLSTCGQNPVTRIIKAIKASATTDIYVDYPIVITDTESTEFCVVTEKNEKEIMDKLS